MELDVLIRRIEERMAIMRWSERETMRKAQVGETSIRNLRSGHSPKIETLAALAGALKVPAPYFLLAGVKWGIGPASLEMEAVFVKGAVQAGVWNEALEWEPSDWMEVTAPVDPRLPRGAERFGLVLRGSSMNRLYTPGSILLCVRYYDLMRGPKSGDKVIVVRRSANLGGFEATCKEYELDNDGRHVLWPRSFDPEFQQAIVLPAGNPLPVADVQGKFTSAAEWDEAAFHQAGEPELLITARVVTSIRDEAPDL